jgi:hypothetical protein
MDLARRSLVVEVVDQLSVPAERLGAYPACVGSRQSPGRSGTSSRRLPRNRFLDNDLAASSSPVRQIAPSQPPQARPSGAVEYVAGLILSLV